LKNGIECDIIKDTEGLIPLIKVKNRKERNYFVEFIEF